jgi:H+/Cl- antiporter ClcA
MESHVAVFPLPFSMDTGVDMAIASIGSGCAKAIGVAFKVDPRTRALYIQAGLSAALSTFLPSPMLGVLLVQELSIISRPGNVILSSTELQQRTSTMILGEDNNYMPVPSLVDHDIMEQVLIASIATASCTTIITVLFPDSIVESMRIQSYDLPQTSNGCSGYLDWLLAIPLGLLSGVIVTLGSLMYLKWNWTRVTGCAFLMNKDRFHVLAIGGQVLFALLAGLICGVLGFLWSYPSLFDNDVNSWQNILPVDASSGGLSPYEVLHFGLHVLMGVTICIGCGILGGCVFPMLSVGACVGVGISCHVFPLALAVPCCMAGCISGFLPAPFTTVLTVSMMFNLDSNQSTSVLLATVASFTVTGGSGLLRRLAAYAWRMSLVVEESEEVEDDIADLAEVEDEERTPHDIDIQERRRLADYEIRQEISSKIFGCSSTEED